MSPGAAAGATDEDREAARQAQAGALEAFGADFNVWANKQPALKIMQLKTDGPFRTGRKWYSQFFATPDDAAAVQKELNGIQLSPDPKYQQNINETND